MAHETFQSGDLTAVMGDNEGYDGHRAGYNIYEVKWDGYRALAAKHGEAVRLLSLNNKDLAGDFPSVVRAVKTIAAHTALLDGEIVAIGAKGQPSFQALQNRSSLGRDWHTVYYAFDLLNLEGEDLKGLPLEQRKKKLKSLVQVSG
jgi:bifunctional non-homologous end joining protein LigD